MGIVTETEETEEIPDSRSYHHSSRLAGRRLTLAPGSLKCLATVTATGELTDSRVLVLDLSPSPDPSIQM